MQPSSNSGSRSARGKVRCDERIYRIGFKRAYQGEEITNIDEIVEDSINLAVHLLLMVLAGRHVSGYNASGRFQDQQFRWREGAIRDFIGSIICSTVFGEGKI